MRRVPHQPVDSRRMDPGARTRSRAASGPRKISGTARRRCPPASARLRKRRSALPKRSRIPPLFSPPPATSCGAALTPRLFTAQSRAFLFNLPATADAGGETNLPRRTGTAGTISLGTRRLRSDVTEILQREMLTSTARLPKLRRTHCVRRESWHDSTTSFHRRREIGSPFRSRSSAGRCPRRIGICSTRSRPPADASC